VKKQNLVGGGELRGVPGAYLSIIFTDFGQFHDKVDMTTKFSKWSDSINFGIKLKLKN